jgi:hypothetical protein
MPRKAHVYRIYATDDQGNVTDDGVYLDVMRIDKIDFLEGLGNFDSGPALRRAYGINWGDDTPGSWSTNRKYRKLEVDEPSASGGNGGSSGGSGTFVNIPMIEKMSFDFRGATGKAGLEGHTGQLVLWAFKNEPDSVSPSARKETALRITNNDLAHAINFPQATVGSPNPPTGVGKGVAWADYAQALHDGTIDDSQYVDVLVTDSFNIRFPPPTFQGVMIRYGMIQKQAGDGTPGVEDVFKQSPNGAGPHTYRIDPFQCIVNVSWGGLAVEFGDGAGGPPDSSGSGGAQ